MIKLFFKSNNFWKDEKNKIFRARFVKKIF